MAKFPKSKSSRGGSLPYFTSSVYGDTDAHTEGPKLALWFGLAGTLLEISCFQLQGGQLVK